MERGIGRIARIDFGEFLRFLLTGLTATAGNLSAVWVFRHVMPYQWALIPGIMVASLISFLMSKFFAFRARNWRQAGGEAARFLVVYLSGVSIYWAVSVTAGTLILPRALSASSAETLGVLMGAGIMTFTSYFGHRYYTYGNRVAIRAR